MTVNSRTTIEELVAEANDRIETLPVEDAIGLHGRDDVVFVDLRDVRELERDGRIAGAFHMPRGMVEFWVDPTSPYFKSLFDEDKRFCFYCAKDWRSALATDVATQYPVRPPHHPPVLAPLAGFGG